MNLFQLNRVNHIEIMAPNTRRKSRNEKPSMTKTKTTQSTTAVRIGRKCNDCDRLKENPFLYARHLLMVHHKPTKCPFHDCGRKLKSLPGLMNHFRGTHNNACSLCGQSTKNPNGLLVHLALVHDLKRCVCNVSRRERMKALC